MRRPQLGADPRERRPAVPRRRSRQCFAGGPVRRGLAPARNRDTDDPDRTAAPAPSTRWPAPCAERAGRGLARRQRALVLGRHRRPGSGSPQAATTSPPSLSRGSTTRSSDACALERIGWERFLETADAELRAQDDYGKLWATQIRLDGEHAHLVEVVNATAEPRRQLPPLLPPRPTGHAHRARSRRLDVRIRKRRRLHPRRRVIVDTRGRPLTARHPQ